MLYTALLLYPASAALEHTPPPLFSAQPLLPSEYLSFTPRPFVRYWRCTSMEKYRLVHAACPLSEIWRLSAIREQLMYCVYGKSSQYNIH